MKKTTEKNKFFLLAALFILVTIFFLLTINQDAPLIFLLGLVVTTAMLATLFHYLHWFKLDDRQLFKQPLFILVTAYPVYLFILFGTWIWKDYGLSLSSEGYSQFLEISKFPLIILASSVPFGAIVSNIHRTIQTEKQIDDSGAKNRNDMYYGHIKFILDQFDKIKGKQIIHDYVLEKSSPSSQGSEPENKTIKMESCIFIKQPMDLYRKIYKNSSPQKSSNFEVCTDFLSVLYDEWQKIHNLCLYKKEWIPEQLFKSPQELRIKDYSDIDITYTNICNHLCLGGFHSEQSLAFQAKMSGWQWYSTFPTGAHMYNSLCSLATVTGLILDRVRDENVDRFFPSNKSVFKIGSGFINDLNMFFDAICIGPYQPPSLTYIRGLHLEDGINKI